VHLLVYNTQRIFKMHDATINLMKQFENTSYSSVPDVWFNTALFPSSQESPACPSEKSGNKKKV